MDPTSETGQLELPIHPETASAPGSGYFRLFRGTLFEPKATFQRLNGPLSIPFALFFAVSVHWAGSALEFIWKSSIGSLVADRASFWSAALEKAFLETADTDRFPFIGLKEKIIHWIWGVGSVLIDPLKTLYQLLILTFFIWIAGRIFHQVPPEDERFESRLSFPMALTIVCLAQGPSILAGIPVFGSVVTAFLGFLVLALGAQVTYRTSFMRGVLIASFPTLIYMGSILFGILVLLNIAFNALARFVFNF